MIGHLNPITFTPILSHVVFNNMTGKSSTPVTTTQKDNIAQALSQVAAEGSKFMNGDDEARERLVTCARELVAMAETPVESLLWNIWALVRGLLYTETTTMLTKASLAISYRCGARCRGPEDLRDGRHGRRPAQDRLRAGRPCGSVADAGQTYCADVRVDAHA